MKSKKEILNGYEGKLDYFLENAGGLPERKKAFKKMLMDEASAEIDRWMNEKRHLKSVKIDKGAK